MGLVGVLRPPGPAAAQVWAQVWAQVRVQLQASGAPLQRLQCDGGLGSSGPGQPSHAQALLPHWPRPPGGADGQALLALPTGAQHRGEGGQSPGVPTTTLQAQGTEPACVGRSRMTPIGFTRKGGRFTAETLRPHQDV